MEILAIIPARGGSKSVPRKNLRLFAGKPLIAHTIEHARLAQGISRIIVSTDDPEIASVSKQCGAEVVQRPKDISTDEASSELALLHVIKFLQEKEGYKPDIIVFLQCTSPLISTEDIAGSIRTFLEKEADSVLAVVPFHGFIWEYDCQGQATGINHDKAVRIRRQDLKPQYQETGAIYVMKTEGFLKSKNRFFGKIAMHLIPAEHGYEINDLADFQIAEVLFLAQKESKTDSLQG